MRKSNFIVLLFSFLFILSSISQVFSLDPVTPASKRGSGMLRVDTPRPETDACEVVSLENHTYGNSVSCKPGETLWLPIGNYQVKVRLQDSSWDKSITIHSTELTSVAVTGYGNLKVNTPSPAADRVEVYSTEGQWVASFPASEIKTLPVGTYHLRIKVGEEGVADTAVNNVEIYPNETRPVDVSY